MQVQVGGDFVLTRADLERPLLFLAGGIGITPMVSMISHYIEQVCDPCVCGFLLPSAHTLSA